MSIVRRRIVLSMSAAASLILLAGTVESCTSHSRSQTSATNTTTTSNAARPTTEPINSHWVQDKHLRELMAELSKRNPSWPASMPDEPEAIPKSREEDFEAVAREANGLMLAAEKFPSVAENIKMNEADREGFLAQARVLGEQARRLRDAARQRRLDQMQEQMVWLNSTCLSCHSRYRDFSGQLDSTRASLR